MGVENFSEKFLPPGLNTEGHATCLEGSHATQLE